MNNNKALDVYYHGRHVGTMAITIDKRVAFQYSPEWLETGFSISPFSLPLKPGVFVPRENSKEIFRGLFGVFADSLPDSWGELLLDRYLASKGVNSGDISVLDRLAYIGESGMGALEYYPSNNKDFNIDYLGLNYDEIASECNNILSSRESNQLDVLYDIAGSSGGTRPKILLKDSDKEWIVKFPSGKDPSICGKREYDYSLCAKKCKINMTETNIVKSKICDGYFKTERFDRDKGNKVFTITFAGLLEADFRAPSCDYSTYMKLINVLTKENKHDLEQMYRIMCFNVLTHNRDDHAKNFSFIYSEDGGWRLAPAYDLTFSDTYFGEHTTSINGKGKDILDKDIIKVGSEAGLKKNDCIDILQEIKNETLMLKEYFEIKSQKRKKIEIKERLEEYKKEGI